MGLKYLITCFGAAWTTDPMQPSVHRAIDLIAGDRVSSATALLPRAVDVLRRTRATEPAELPRVALALCRAQPCMGSIWNAAATALDETPAALERFAREAARAPDAIARVGQGLFGREDAAGAGHVTIATWSSSRPVLRVLERLSVSRAVVVRCAEARPGLEGRALATALGKAGMAVEVYPDGALAAALAGVAAVLVGADAVTPESFINKAGTSALALAAAAFGVPTYVLAGRDKCLSEDLAGRVTLRDGAPEEVWTQPAHGVTVRNPYFERIPWTYVAALVTDRGRLGPGDAADLCRSAGRVFGQHRLVAAMRDAGVVPRPAANHDPSQTT